MKIDSGRTTQIEEYLGRNFAKCPSGWLARVLAKSTDHSCQIESIDIYPGYQSFAPTELYWIKISEPFLEYPELPLTKSRGLFGFLAGKCLHLSYRTPELFSQVISQVQEWEGVSDDILGQLFCDAVMTRRDVCYRVLADRPSVEAILPLQGIAAVSAQFQAQALELYQPPLREWIGSQLELSFRAVAIENLTRLSIVKFCVRIDSVNGMFTVALEHLGGENQQYRYFLRY